MSAVGGARELTVTASSSRSRGAMFASSMTGFRVHLPLLEVRRWGRDLRSGRPAGLTPIANAATAHHGVELAVPTPSGPRPARSLCPEAVLPHGFTAAPAARISRSSRCRLRFCRSPILTTSARGPAKAVPCDPSAAACGLLPARPRTSPHFSADWGSRRYKVSKFSTTWHTACKAPWSITEGLQRTSATSW